MFIYNTINTNKLNNVVIRNYNVKTDVTLSHKSSRAGGQKYIK